MHTLRVFRLGTPSRVPQSLHRATHWNRKLISSYDQAKPFHTLYRQAIRTNTNQANRNDDAVSASSEKLDPTKFTTQLSQNITGESAVPIEAVIPVQTISETCPKTLVGAVRYYLSGYCSLSKAKLSSLVLLTTMAGYAMAPGAFDLGAFVIVSFGTGATICAANSINQILEVSNDSLMNRTKKRWLPTKKITLSHAKTFAAVCSISGVGSLLLLNPLTSGLAAFNLFLYTSVYTPMKQKNPANTWVGAIVGAIPPMIGWAAVTGGMEVGSWVIGALLAFWQMPHFMALSYSLKDDYFRGGFKMLINTHPEKVPGVLMRYSLAMVPIGLLSAMCEMTTWWFALDSLLPTGYLVYLAWQFRQNPDKLLARKIFKFTLLFLPVMMALMLLHKSSPSKEDEKQIEESKQDDSTLALLTSASS